MHAGDGKMAQRQPVFHQGDQMKDDAQRDGAQRYPEESLPAFDDGHTAWSRPSEYNPKATRSHNWFISLPKPRCLLIITDFVRVASGTRQ